MPLEQGEQSDLVAAVTEIVRKADRDFERVGGSSRHWVRDCFLPTLNAGGFLIVQQVAPPYPAICRHCNEELRLMDGEWCNRETHTICPDTVGKKHEPATFDPARVGHPDEGTAIGSASPSSSLSLPGGPQAQGWQPIATFDKESGDEFIAGWAGTALRKIVRWSDHGGHRTKWWRDHDGFALVEPTHWMPLPLPPVPSREDEKGQP